MMRRVFASFTFGLALAVGCSPATPGSGAGPRSSSNVLTKQEIAASPYLSSNVYEAIEKLRPAFFRARTTSSGPGYRPVLYLDGIRRESLEFLKAVPSSEVSEVRYLTVQDATTRYGMNVPAGVLEVKLIGR